ncbi:MAG: acylphosphatase [Ignavibacteria bacterium]|nr:acylphosphatase [Ignavibacteria bacterium]
MEKRFKIIVTGLVQGVGYRYFCYRKAKEYSLNGFAENLVNGNVLIEVEGNADSIKSYMQELKVGPYGAYVKSVHTEELPVINDSKGFRIN